MGTSTGTEQGTGTAHEPPRAGSFESGYVEAAGLRLHFLDYGSVGRAPLLCVHGGGAHAHWFDFIAPGLCTDYHVRALDLRGHGDSAWSDPPDYAYERYAADLDEVVERLDLRDFVLIGHSMGGMVSLLHAATHPGRVGKLIIVDSTLQMTEERVANIRSVGFRESKSYATKDEILQRFRLRPAGTLARPEVIAHLAQHSARQGEDGRWRYKFDRNVFARRVPMNGLPYWEHIRVPALLVKGDRSGRITAEVEARIRAKCPQVEVAEVSHSEHHVTLDNPAEFVQVVRAFLDRHR